MVVLEDREYAGNMGKEAGVGNGCMNGSSNVALEFDAPALSRN